MAEILCLNCNEIVTFGDNCKCYSYGNYGHLYSLSRLHAFDQKNAENIEPKDKYLCTPTDNYSNLYSELQPSQIKDYENLKLPKKENNEEPRLSDLNKVEKLSSLTDEKRITDNFEKQSDNLLPSLNFKLNYVNSNEFPIEISIEPCEADFKLETEAFKNCKKEQILKSFFHQQESCEGDPFIYIDQTPSKECKMLWHKNNFHFFNFEEKLPNPFGAASQEIHLENNDFSTTANLLINRNYWPVGEISYENVNNESELSLTGSLNFPEVPAPSDGESISLVDKVLTSIESKKDGNNVLGHSVFLPDFIISQNMKPIVEKISECDNSENRSFNQNSLPRIYKSDFSNNITVCDNSHKVISRRDQLETLKRKHNLKKQFVCNLCEKSFPFKYKTY